MKYGDKIVKMDLNVNNRFGFYNSIMFQVLGEYDQRFVLLTIIVKHMARLEGLPGSVSGITSYALCNLVVFFFQNLTLPIFPFSIQDLFNQVKVESGTPIFSQSQTRSPWQLNLPTRIDKTKFQTENSSNIRSLLKNFSDFYKPFDWKNKAVDILNGKARQVEKPLNQKRLMTIWDPIEQHHNLTQHITTKNFIKS